MTSTDLKTSRSTGMILLAALIGLGLVAIWQTITYRATAVGTLEISVIDGPQTPENLAMAVGFDRAAIASQGFIHSVMTGSLRPPPTGIDQMSVGEFTSRMQVRNEPDTGYLDVQFSSETADDARSAVTAIMETYQEQEKHGVAIAKQPQIIPTARWHALPLILGALVGGGLAAGYFGIRRMNAG